MFLFIQAYPLMFMTYRWLEMWMIEKCAYKGMCCGGFDIWRIQKPPVETVEMTKEKVRGGKEIMGGDAVFQCRCWKWIFNFVE